MDTAVNFLLANLISFDHCFFHPGFPAMLTTGGSHAYTSGPLILEDQLNPPETIKSLDCSLMVFNTNNQKRIPDVEQKLAAV